MAILLTLVGAGLIVVAATRPWASVTLTGLPGMSSVTVSGSQVAPSGVPIALAAAAGAFVLATAGPLVRMLIGAGLAIAGGGVAFSSVQVGRDAGAVVASALRDSLGLFSSRSTAGAEAFGASFGGTRADLTIWPWVATVGGVLVALSGILVIVAGRHWSASGRRFERPTGPGPLALGASSTAGAGAIERSSTDDGAAATWDALSRGEDPTWHTVDPSTRGA